jgi:hypothetical protein
MKRRPPRQLRMRPVIGAIIAATLLAAGSLFAACGGDDGKPANGTIPGGTSPASGPADITGTVRTFEGIAGNSDGRLATMLVVADGDAPSQYDRAQVTITSATVIWRPVGEGRVTLDVGALHAGDRVAVTFTGPVAESYPVQATASDVELLEPAAVDGQ